jgi:hypothetical protein
MKFPTLLTSLAVLVAAPHIVRAEPDCPDAFRGAAITTNQIHDGVALTFTTDGTKVDIMRDQLRELAMMIEQKGTEVQTASYDEDVEFPSLDIDVKDMAGGALVSVRASRPRDIPELRELATSFQRYWDASSCHGDDVAKAPPGDVVKPAAKKKQRARRQARR